MMTLSINGIDEIKKALDTLPRRMSRQIYIGALRRAALPLRDQARANAPVRTGALRNRIAVVTSDRFRGDKSPAVSVRVNNRGRARSKRAYYANIIEGGSRPHILAPLEGRGRGKTLSDKPKVLSINGRIITASKTHPIKHPGSRPYWFLKRAFQAKARETIDVFEREFGAVFERQVRRLFKR